MNRLYLKHFATAIAALSAAATLLTVLFDLDCVKVCWVYGTIGSILVVGGSLLYAWWQTRSKKKIELSLSSELKLSIKEGDLFKQKGIVCIPVNEYFDTHVGDGVVGKDTLHGKFICNYYGDRIQELVDKINDQLANKPYTVHNRRIPACPNRQYQLGTCVDIRDGENLYVLFALTHFDDNDIANMSRVEYVEVVRKLMDHLSLIAEGKPVYMPLFGTGLARLKRTPQRILYHLVDTIDFDDVSAIPGGLNIVIWSLDDINVNLTLMEYIVKNGITKTEG